MRRSPKIKPLATRMPLRKAATSGQAAGRRNFPAWIDAGEYGMPAPVVAMPRVRDGLVLRAVPTRKNKTEASDAHGAR